MAISFSVGGAILAQKDKEWIRNKEICYLYDQTNLRIDQVADRFGLIRQEVKKILMDDAYASQ